MGGTHVRFFNGNDAFDSDDPNNTINAVQHALAALWKNEVGAAGQLYIYSELGIFH